MKTLKAYAFDLDDNLIVMLTKVKLKLNLSN